MRAGLDQLYETLLTFGYPPAGIDWLKQHRLSVIIALAVLCWIVLLAAVVGAAWFFSAALGSLPVPISIP